MNLENLNVFHTECISSIRVKKKKTDYISHKKQQSKIEYISHKKNNREKQSKTEYISYKKNRVKQRISLIKKQRILSFFIQNP
jgi:hypothetical protein